MLKKFMCFLGPLFCGTIGGTAFLQKPGSRAIQMGGRIAVQFGGVLQSFLDKLYGLGAPNHAQHEQTTKQAQDTLF